MSAVSYRSLWENFPIECFEAFAHVFRRTHGMMAPGKDLPAEYGGRDDYDERRRAYNSWRSALGPSDVASLLSVRLMRERQERDQ